MRYLITVALIPLNFLIVFKLIILAHMTPNSPQPPPSLRACSTHMLCFILRAGTPAHTDRFVFPFGVTLRSQRTLRPNRDRTVADSVVEVEWVYRNAYWMDSCALDLMGQCRNSATLLLTFPFLCHTWQALGVWPKLSIHAVIKDFWSFPWQQHFPYTIRKLEFILNHKKKKKKTTE